MQAVFQVVRRAMESLKVEVARVGTMLKLVKMAMELLKLLVLGQAVLQVVKMEMELMKLSWRAGGLW